MVFYWKANIYIFWFVFSQSTCRAHANSSLSNCIHGLNANQFTDLPILTRTQNDSGSVPVPRTLFCTSALVRFGSHLLNSRLITKCFVSSDAAVGSADECTACGATLNWAIIAVVVRDALSRMCGYLCVMCTDWPSLMLPLPIGVECRTFPLRSWPYRSGTRASMPVRPVAALAIKTGGAKLPGPHGPRPGLRLS